MGTKSYEIVPISLFNNRSH